MGGDAQRLAVTVLHRHVVGRRPVVADQHRAEPGGHATVDQRLHPVGQLGLDPRRRPVLRPTPAQPWPRPYRPSLAWSPVTTPLTIGPLTVDPPVVLAPMAGVTNAAFRQLCRRYGAGLYVSEMVNARGLRGGGREELATGRLRARRVAPIAPAVRHRPDDGGRGRAPARRRRPRRPHRPQLRLPGPARSPATVAVPRAGPPPVVRGRGGRGRPGRRRRAGHGEDADRPRRRADHLPRRRPAGRRRRSRRGGPARPHRASSGTPVEPGGARSRSSSRRCPVHPSSATATSGPRDDAVAMVERTGCAGVVVGRACLGRPWFFGQLADAFGGRPVRPEPPLGEVALTAAEHARLLVAAIDEDRGVRDDAQAPRPGTSPASPSDRPPASASPRCRPWPSSTTPSPTSIRPSPSPPRRPASPAAPRPVLTPSSSPTAGSTSTRSPLPTRWPTPPSVAGEPVTTGRTGAERLVLASGSPRRFELLAGLGLAFELRPADIDESVLTGRGRSDLRRAPGPGPRRRRSPGRASWWSPPTPPSTSTATCSASPTDDDDARRLLGRLSGRTHHVHTGVCVHRVPRPRRPPDRLRHRVVTTAVTFAELPDAWIDWYVGTGEPLDKAGGYGMQGSAALSWPASTAAPPT